MYNDGIDRSKRRKQTGEDFTPTALVFEILRELPEEVWEDSTKTWLDPACGNGQFLYAVMRILRFKLRHKIPNQSKRHHHIVNNMIYGVDLMPDNVIATCGRLGVKILNPKNKIYKSATIVCASTLDYNLETLFTEDYEKFKKSTGKNRKNPKPLYKKAA